MSDLKKCETCEMMLAPNEECERCTNTGFSGSVISQDDEDYESGELIRPLPLPSNRNRHIASGYAINGANIRRQSKRSSDLQNDSSHDNSFQEPLGPKFGYTLESSRSQQEGIEHRASTYQNSNLHMEMQQPPFLATVDNTHRHCAQEGHHPKFRRKQRSHLDTNNEALYQGGEYFPLCMNEVSGHYPFDSGQASRYKESQTRQQSNNAITANRFDQHAYTGRGYTHPGHNVTYQEQCCDPQAQHETLGHPIRACNLDGLVGKEKTAYHDSRGMLFDNDRQNSRTIPVQFVKDNPNGSVETHDFRIDGHYNDQLLPQPGYIPKNENIYNNPRNGFDCHHDSMHLYTNSPRSRHNQQLCNNHAMCSCDFFCSSAASNAEDGAHFVGAGVSFLRNHGPRGTVDNNALYPNENQNGSNHQRLYVPSKQSRVNNSLNIGRDADIEYVDPEIGLRTASSNYQTRKQAHSHKQYQHDPNTQNNKHRHMPHVHVAQNGQLHDTRISPKLTHCHFNKPTSIQGKPELQSYSKSSPLPQRIRVPGHHQCFSQDHQSYISSTCISDKQLHTVMNKTTNSNATATKHHCGEPSRNVALKRSIPLDKSTKGLYSQKQRHHYEHSPVQTHGNKPHVIRTTHNKLDQQTNVCNKSNKENIGDIFQQRKFSPNKTLQFQSSRHPNDHITYQLGGAEEIGQYRPHINKENTQMTNRRSAFNQKCIKPSKDQIRNITGTRPRKSRPRSKSLDNTLDLFDDKKHVDNHVIRTPKIHLQQQDDINIRYSRKTQDMLTDSTVSETATGMPINPEKPTGNDPPIENSTSSSTDAKGPLEENGEFLLERGMGTGDRVALLEHNSGAFEEERESPIRGMEGQGLLSKIAEDVSSGNTIYGSHLVLSYAKADKNNFALIFQIGQHKDENVRRLCVLQTETVLSFELVHDSAFMKNVTMLLKYLFDKNDHMLANLFDYHEGILIRYLRVIHTSLRLTILGLVGDVLNKLDLCTPDCIKRQLQGMTSYVGQTRHVNTSIRREMENEMAYIQMLLTYCLALIEDKGNTTERNNGRGLFRYLKNMQTHQLSTSTLLEQTVKQYKGLGKCVPLLHTFLHYISSTLKDHKESHTVLATVIDKYVSCFKEHKARAVIDAMMCYMRYMENFGLISEFTISVEKYKDKYAHRSDKMQHLLHALSPLLFSRNPSIREFIQKKILVPLREDNPDLRLIALHHLQEKLSSQMLQIFNTDYKDDGLTLVKGTFSNDQSVIAVFRYNLKGTKENQFEMRSPSAQAEIMQSIPDLKHSNLATFVTSSSHEEPLSYIVLETPKQYSNLSTYLLTHLTKENMVVLPLSTRLKISLTIVDVVGFLHDHSVILAGFTAESFVIVPETSQAMLVRMDYAHQCDRNNKELCFTRHSKKDDIPLLWSAPEVLFTAEVSAASDVFCLAHVINEVLSHGLHPYQEYAGVSVAHKLRTILKCNILQERRPGVPEEVFFILMNSLLQDRTTRLRLAKLEDKLKRFEETLVDTSDTSKQTDCTGIDRLAVLSKGQGKVSIKVPHFLYDVDSMEELWVQEDEVYQNLVASISPKILKAAVVTDEVKCHDELRLSKPPHERFRACITKREIPHQQAERNALRKLLHQNVGIIKGFHTSDICKKHTEMEISLDSPTHMTLRQYFAKSLTEEVRLHIYQQVNNGLEYIHSNSFVHGNLKPDNIFAVPSSRNDGSVCVKIGHMSRMTQVPSSDNENVASSFVSPFEEAPLDTGRIQPDTYITMYSDIAMFGYLIWALEYIHGHSSVPSSSPFVPYQHLQHHKVKEAQLQQLPLPFPPRDIQLWLRLFPLVDRCIGFPSSCRPLTGEITTQLKNMKAGQAILDEPIMENASTRRSSAAMEMSQILDQDNEPLQIYKTKARDTIVQKMTGCSGNNYGQVQKLKNWFTRKGSKGNNKTKLLSYDSIPQTNKEDGFTYRISKSVSVPFMSQENEYSLGDENQFDSSLSDFTTDSFENMSNEYQDPNLQSELMYPPHIESNTNSEKRQSCMNFEQQQTDAQDSEIASSYENVYDIKNQHREPCHRSNVYVCNEASHPLHVRNIQEAYDDRLYNGTEETWQTEPHTVQSNRDSLYDSPRVTFSETVLQMSSLPAKCDLDDNYYYAKQDIRQCERLGGDDPIPLPTDRPSYRYRDDNSGHESTFQQETYNVTHAQSRPLRNNSRENAQKQFRLHGTSYARATREEETQQPLRWGITHDRFQSIPCDDVDPIGSEYHT